MHTVISPQRTVVPHKGTVTSPNVTVIPGGNWYGAVLTGAPNYISTEASFNVPTAVPGGDQTTNTAIYIWNGLGGFGTGSGLIQAFVIIQTTPTSVTYDTKREYCCGDNQFTADARFSPNPGDQIYDQSWYCDANGNPNIDGGYGCALLQDMKTGAILSCTSANGTPCSSVKAFPLCSVSPTTSNCMTLGQSAEFIIENGGSSQSSITDFTPPVEISGSAYSSQTNNNSQTVDTDSNVFLLTDTITTPDLIVALGPPNNTCFAISSPSSILICSSPAPPPPPPRCFSGLGSDEIWCARLNRCVTESEFRAECLFVRP